MHSLILKFGRVIPVILIVTFASYALIEILPGDVVDAILVEQEVSVELAEQRRAEIEKKLGLDRPFVVRYFSWLGGFALGDFGESYVTGEPVTVEIARRLPVTLELVLLAQIFACLLSIPVGVMAAYRARQGFDHAITAVSFAILATPIFVLAIILVYLFAIMYPLFPVIGFVPISEGILNNLHTLFLPALVLGLAHAPQLIRIIRVDMISTLSEDFITLARAKGLHPLYILFRHALRPSANGVITVIALQLGVMLSSSVVVEMIFSLPGLGRLLLESIDSRDVIVIQAIVAILAVVYVGLNLTVDMLYKVIDPRIRR